MDKIKKAYAWKESIELSKQLVRLIEEFSDADTNVLVWHLRQAVVDIPSSIAADLQAGRDATMEPIIKLAAGLELVRKIYPALETAEVDELLERVMERLQSDKFAEWVPETEEEEDATQPAAGTVITPVEDEESHSVITSIDPTQDGVITRSN